ncbi:MAG: biotin transporter BioY [Clostridiales bacterium]|jgi:biotin transport system substrate-specific component|nr:biotin transporter BioY [Clostridiales bacterium]
MSREVTAKKIVYVALAVALLFVSGHIKVTVFSIPYTLQTLAVMLIGCIFGERYGLLAAGIYVSMGLLGIPVFSKGGGLHYVFEPSFGYILAFLPGVYLIGSLRKRASSNPYLLFALLFSVAVLMLLIGAMYYMIVIKGIFGAPLPSVLYSFVAIFLPADLIKAIAAALICPRLKRYYV